MIPILGRFAFRSTSIVASTFAVYELVKHDWGTGLGFAISWLFLFLADKRINKAPSDNE